MKPFQESDRYDIPGLTADGVVLDIGGYEGNWGRQICEKYGCEVHIFEPVEPFFRKIITSLIGHPQRARLFVHNFGVGAESGPAVLKIKGDMTGAFADGPDVPVEILGIEYLMERPRFSGKQVGAKLNCEGAEFAILETMLRVGLMSRVDWLHVQPHPVVPDYAARWQAIKDGIAKTHDLTFDSDWCWTGWRIRK